MGANFSAHPLHPKLPYDRATRSEQIGPDHHLEPLHVKGMHYVETAPPPFNEESAELKVRLAEDGWNSRNPEKVALAYSDDSKWRNRAEFVTGRNQIVPFLSRKWIGEHEYRLIKDLWAFRGNRIAFRFAYEHPIAETERKFHWPLGRRPDDDPGLSDFGF